MWRFNDPVKVTLSRQEAGALREALLLLINEHEDEVEAGHLDAILKRMMTQVERK
jgi:hypothetical protein